MRTIKTQSDHDKMVKAMADKLEREGMQVQADHIGHKNGQPTIIGGYIPDVVGSSYSKKIIVEAETQDTISAESTKDQMESFSNIPGTEFHMIVPKGYISQMEGQARQWDIRIDKMWHMDV